MKPNLSLTISKKPSTNGIMSVKQISIREKFLRFLFGKKVDIAIFVPGDQIDEVIIQNNKISKK